MEERKINNEQREKERITWQGKKGREEEELDLGFFVWKKK